MGTNTDVEKKFSEDHINYLLRLFENENGRLEKLESKINQIIGQSGLIISITTFIVPLFYDSLKNLDLYLKVSMVVTFLITLILMGLSIYNASRIYNIKKFMYADCDEETVNKNHQSIEDFRKEYIEDLIYSIKRNRNLNNSKGTILLDCNRLFSAGIYFLVLLIIQLLAGGFVI